MPILPENRKRYPANWNAIRAAILAEYENKCEFCGVENYSTRDGAKVVLTIAHLDHVPEHCGRENLRALCQRCHNRYDAKHRARTRKRFADAPQSELDL
jgi:5-methylcytosine-specific restriction endonuclease McrA